MDDYLDNSEIQDIKDILENFYGNQVQGWPIKLATLDVLGKLIEKTKVCDNMMNLVPRPYGGGPAVNWGKRQVRQTVIRRLKDSNGKHYIACMKASAASMRTEFYMSGFSGSR